MTNELFCLDLGGEVAVKAIDAELVTLEGVEAAREAYDAFREELESEWPTARLRSFLLDLQRQRCQWCLKKINDLELQNADARKNGVSYRERQRYASKMQAARNLFEYEKQKGIEFRNRKTLGVSDFVQPSDMPFISKRGVEQHLRYATI